MVFLFLNFDFDLFRERESPVKKRKAPAADTNIVKQEAKKKRENTPKFDKKLPKRNIIDPGEVEPEPEEPKPKVDKKEKKKEKIVIKKEPQKPQKPVKIKPFHQLMDNVVFTISGFQNPLRGEIRQKAIDMGARYRGDWDSTCTHLVCAFVNTPKFNQVKGKGKIIKVNYSK